jgi:hypothetical protein
LNCLKAMLSPFLSHSALYTLTNKRWKSKFKNISTIQL